MLLVVLEDGTLMQTDAETEVIKEYTGDSAYIIRFHQGKGKFQVQWDGEWEDVELK